MINGVKTKLLRVIPDERGRVMEILRADDDLFLKFDQVERRSRVRLAILQFIEKIWTVAKKPKTFITRQVQPFISSLTEIEFFIAKPQGTL